MTELHDLLRHRTTRAHHGLDARLATEGFLDSALGYLHFLEGWCHLQSHVEQRLESAGVERVLTDWPLRRRAHLLASDLAALPAPSLSPVELPRPSAPMSLAGVLGTAYVVEGATLGATILLPRFTK